MASYNKVLLLGNLTRDPELRYTSGGTAVCQFGLAVNRTYSTADGAKKEETAFVDCEAWAKQAELIGEYLHKGSPIFFDGRLRLDQWESKEGQKRSKLKVVVENFQFLGRAEDEQSAPRKPDRPAQPDADDFQDDDDDSIPF